MRCSLFRSALVLAAGVAVCSCSETPLSSLTQKNPPRQASVQSVTVGDVVISQVYGGGGNSGATYKNDFIELFNRGTQTVDLAGWSVQYASASGTTWTVTALTGTLAPGQYFLIQEAAGAGGTTALPTPDVVAPGSGIAMSGSAGKVALSQTSATLSGGCPSGGDVLDVVGYGTTSCSPASAPALSNTTAALRKADGCTYSGNAAADFDAAAPTPRNTASAIKTCGTVIVVGPPATVTVTPGTADIVVNKSQRFSAAAQDAQSQPVPGTTFTWSSSAPSVVSIDPATGIATALQAGDAFISATTSNGVVGTASAHVIVVGDVVISQIYGGGGNSGATYTNDYIELFNRSDVAANVGGWQIQYASATGSAWSNTTVTLPGATIPAGGYYLVQLSGGSTGGPLPLADATGSINMAAGSGKVLLTMPGVSVGDACPVDGRIIDRVGYGTGSNCASEWGGTTPTLSSSIAAFRNNDGCVSTGSVSADFVAQTPNPRNSASQRKACAGGGPPTPLSDAKLVINELMGDPLNAESASWGEWFEVYNYGTTDIDLQGWTIASGGSSQPDHTIASSVIVPAGGYAVLGRGADMMRNGGVPIDYNYFVGNSSTIWLDNSDYLVLRDAAGARVDSVQWTSLPRGTTKGLRDAALAHASVDGSSWWYSTTTFGDGDFGTPGATNGTLSATPPALPNRITFGGRLPSDPALPAGFEDQIFATLHDGTTDAVIITTFTWQSLTPAVAPIDNNGVLHALVAGTATVQATAADGTTRRLTLPIVTPVASVTAQYGNNTEFGTPADADASDDFIVQRPQYTTSYSRIRNTPNWVAYDLDGSQIDAAGSDRCDCFTFDPQLPADYYHYTTATYTGLGGSRPYHGYPIDRGHLARSFDRTTGSLDNATTFYFSNIIPQASDLNQGPWAVLETYLGDQARYQNKEVYIIAGVAGSKGTVKDEGFITIPAQVWKVAVIMPRDRGIADVHDYRDVQVIAVVMPNDPGVRNVDWHSYQKTVDEVEALSGYDLLALLPDKIERAVESGTYPPIASLDGPYNGIEGSAVAMSAAASVDPNGSIVSYQWSFGDGSTGSGVGVNHTYALDGTYNVQLVVTDNDALVDTVATTVTVAALPTAQRISYAQTLVDGLVSAGKLNAGTGNSLNVKLNAARRQLGGDTPAVVNQLQSFVNELNALVGSARLTSEDARVLLSLADRLIRSVGVE